MIQTDNAANILALKKGACENALVMDLIRILTAEQIKGNFSVRLVHICSEANTTADLLSRGNIHAVQVANLQYVRIRPVFLKNFRQLADANNETHGTGQAL